MNLGSAIAEQAYAESFQKGFREGEERTAALFRKLLDEKDAVKLDTAQLGEIASRMADDREYRKKMFKEYGIE